MSVLNLANISQPLTNITMDGDAKDVAVEVGHILTTIFNSITYCPFAVVLNVLLIMAVKRRPRLQSYNNTLLACLAVTAALKRGLYSTSNASFTQTGYGPRTWSCYLTLFCRGRGLNKLLTLLG